MQRAHAASSGAKCEYDDDSIIVHGLSECPRLFVPEVYRQTLRSASEISYTHRAGIAVAIYFSESLNLHGAGK